MYQRTDLNLSETPAYRGQEVGQRPESDYAETGDVAGIAIAVSDLEAALAALPTLASGTYTPTLTGQANVAASTPSSCKYIRVGNIVTVSGSLAVTATSATVQTVLGISLPIASNLGATTDLAGSGASGGVLQAGTIRGDSTNDWAQIVFIAQDTSSRGMGFTFSYQLLP